MGGTTVEAPDTPDPAVVAAAQGDLNFDSALSTALLNQYNTVSPYGTTSFDQTGSYMVDGREVPQFTQTTALSDLGQQRFDTQEAITGGLSDLALSNIGNIANAQSTPFSLEGLPAFATSAGGGGGGGGMSLAGLPDISLQDLQTQLDTSGLNEVRTDFGAQQDELEGALFDRAMARINPEFDRQAQALNTNLTNRGLPVGSESFQGAMDPFERRRNEATANAGLDAVMGGYGLQNQMFGQDLALRGQQFGEVLGAGQFGNEARNAMFGQSATARGQLANERYQQGQLGLQGQQMKNQMGMFNANLQNQARQQSIQEQLLQRQQPLNELSALLGTGPALGMPQFQSAPQVGMSAPDMMGYQMGQNQMAMNAANQSAANKGGLMSGLMGLGGSLGSAAILMSDIRLKSNIKRIGKTSKGFNLYEYIIGGVKEIGVLAQEVMKTAPEAVVKVGDYYAVNYEVVR